MANDLDTAPVVANTKSEVILDITAALQKLDRIALEMERKWGSSRLPALVSDELAERFHSQHREVCKALRGDRAEEAFCAIERMVAAWRYLDNQAHQLGAEPIASAVWEVTLSDGTVVAIVRNEDDAAAVSSHGRAMRVYLLSEVARLIEAVPGVMAIKDQFPGARIIPMRTNSVDLYGWKLGDELPF